MSDDEPRRSDEASAEPTPPSGSGGTQPPAPRGGDVAPLFPVPEAETEAPFWARPSGPRPVWADPEPNPGLPPPDAGVHPEGSAAPASRRPTWIAGALAAVGVIALLAFAMMAWHPWSAGPRADPAPVSPTPVSPTPGTSGTSGASPSPVGPRGGIGEWLVAVNSYCRSTVDPAIKAAALDPDVAAYFTRIASINRQLDARLRRSAPSSLQGDVEHLAGDWDRMAALYDQAAAAAAGGNRALALTLARQAEDANQAGNDLAVKIGLPDCASAGGIGETPSPTQAFI